MYCDSSDCEKTNDAVEIGIKDISMKKFTYSNVQKDREWKSMTFEFTATKDTAEVKIIY
jgi:hypothetical protein